MSWPGPAVKSLCCARYPVLFDDHLTAERTQQLLTGLQDGAYLDAELTLSLTARVLTYNPEAGVFGFW